MNDKTDIEEGKPVTETHVLIGKVHELIGNPLSVWAVAATIESLGVRDTDAKNDFGYESVFDLADIVYDRLKSQVKEGKHAFNQDEVDKYSINKRPFREGFWMFLKHYALGLLFSLPMLSQVASVLIFRYSLWAWLDFNEAQATVVAFGTIGAFVVTGGFIQVLGRSVSKYMSEDNYFLTFEAAKKIMKSGVITLACVIIFFYLLNVVIPFYPQAMLLLGLVYMGLISLLLLTSGVLYALEQRVMILVCIIIGTGVVIAGMDLFEIGIYLSQWLGLTVTIALLAGYGRLYLKLKIRFNRQDLIKQSLSSAEVRYYINYRYFVYGSGYFLFLFMDRILAWTAGPPPPPYIMWFNTPYELGMDWALVSLVLSIALLEYSVHDFSKQLLPLQKKAFFLRSDIFNNFFKRFYIKQLCLLFILGVASILITYYSINSLKQFADQIPEIRDFFENPMTTHVFFIASISYLFLVIGLLHTLFFFTLNKPSFAMYSIIGATLVNFVIGYICSRIWALQYASIGLAAGAVAFALISGFIAKNFFKRLDYYYYSAF